MSDEKPLKPFTLNTIACHGCGACAEVAPDIFRMDPQTDLPCPLASEGPEESIRQAMTYCPNECIEMGE